MKYIEKEREREREKERERKRERERKTYYKDKTIQKKTQQLKTSVCLKEILGNSLNINYSKNHLKQRLGKILITLISNQEKENKQSLRQYKEAAGIGVWLKQRIDSPLISVQKFSLKFN